MVVDKQPRILLVNPPLYDLRLDWAQWHQPCGLLQVGSLLRSKGNDVRFIDCLQSLKGNRIQRSKLDTITLESVGLQRWHFGLSWDQIEKRIEELREEKWSPDAIYVTSLMTFWWQGARDLIEYLRNWFPKRRIVLGGVYPTLCLNHAKKSIGGVHFDSELSKRAKNYATDFRLYDGGASHFAGIFLHRLNSAERVIGEIETKIRHGVREFAFFDDEIPGKDATRFERVLDLIIERRLNIQLRALGNLSAKALTHELAVKMKYAGYRQIFLRDDIALNPDANGDLSAYERGIEVLSKDNLYKQRTDDVTAMVLVGVPGENLEHVAERLTQLAHVVGSVNLVPFQPTPGTSLYRRHQQCLDPIPLELQNGKLFPFAKFNHATFTDYQELTRLAALLNSKFRSTTFDFLGENGIAQMVRKAISEETWRPLLKETIPLSSE